MTDETTNMPNFANYPQLDKHPQQLNPEVAQKDSALNQDLIQTAEWLKSNKDKVGTEEYIQHFNMLETMAQKGYPMAEFEYAKLLQHSGELNKAAIYFDRAKNNENAGLELKKEIKETTANSVEESKQQEQADLAQKTEKSDEDKLKKAPYKTFNAHAHETEQESEEPEQQEQADLAQKAEKSDEDKLKRDPYKTFNAHAHETEQEAEKHTSQEIQKESVERLPPELMEQIQIAKDRGQG